MAAPKRSAAAAGLDDKRGDDVVKVGGGSRPSREMQGSGRDGKKHSMDSDDEDEYGKVDEEDLLKDDDIEGQEELAANVDRDQDGEVKITPFNLREEMEEGHFSKDGNFVWKADNEIKDSWLDNIDWVKVKQVSAEENFRRDEGDEKEDAAEAAYDEVKAYRGCLKLMRPGESVAAAIRRLGGGKQAAPRWKQKQLQKKLQRNRGEGGSAGPAEDQQDREKQDRELMQVLSGLADSILSRSGNMEIYQETYEKIAFMLKQEDERQNKVVVPDGVDDDDALDMFADDMDKRDKNPAKPEKGSDSAKMPPPPSQHLQSASSAPLDVDDEVRWEFKWAGSSEEPTEVHGPHTSQEMLDWQTSGFFDKGVLVRKLGSQGDFLDGKRVDFELYT